MHFNELEKKLSYWKVVSWIFKSNFCFCAWNVFVFLPRFITAWTNMNHLYFSIFSSMKLDLFLCCFRLWFYWWAGWKWMYCSRTCWVYEILYTDIEIFILEIVSFGQGALVAKNLGFPLSYAVLEYFQNIQVTSKGVYTLLSWPTFAYAPLTKALQLYWTC